MKIKILFLLIALFSFNCYSQTGFSIYSNEVYFTTANPKFVIKVEDSSDANYEIDTLGDCEIKEHPIFKFKYYDYPDLVEIFKCDTIDIKGIPLCEKDTVFNYETFMGNKHELEAYRIILFGDLKNLMVEKCKSAEIKSTINGIRDFLNDKSYCVETEGEVNISLKRGLTDFAEANGLHSHWYLKLKENITIDWEKIELEFCNCIGE